MAAFGKIMNAHRGAVAAVATPIDALGESRIEGVKTNMPTLRAVLASDEFRAGRRHTELVGEVLRRLP